MRLPSAIIMFLFGGAAGFLLAGVLAERPAAVAVEIVLSPDDPAAVDMIEALTQRLNPAEED